MKTPSLAAALLLAAASAFAAPDASFDQSLDVSAALSAAKDAARKDATVVEAQSIGGMRYDVDCAVISFGATDAPVSGAVHLRSQEWVTECHPVGDPRHGGGQQCWERPGTSWYQDVSITLQNRQPLLPWERDAFRVCLQGPWVDTHVIEAAYDYRIVSGGADTGRIVLAGGRKTPESPDSAGITGQISAQLQTTFADRWASYYAGEQVVLKVQLMKVVKFWPDALVLEKEIRVPVATAYSLDMSQAALSAASRPEAGKEYYAKYSFKRIGSVSKDSWTRSQKTTNVTYAPGTLAFAR